MKSIYRRLVDQTEMESHERSLVVELALSSPDQRLLTVG